MMHLIKLTTKDRDTILTRVNGDCDFNEIVGFYRNNNRTNWLHKREDSQITKIDFIESKLLEGHSSLVYLFIDYDNTGLLS